MRTMHAGEGPEGDSFAWDAGSTVEIAESELSEMPSLWVRISAPSMRDEAMFIPLSPGEAFVVGSGESADVHITCRTVSARHCRVVHTGLSVDVVDLGSTNGVRAGGIRVARASLVPGIPIELGRVSLRIELERANPPSVHLAPPLSQLVGDSLPMRHLAAAVRRAARLHLPVLLRGETGTGKELVARAIHEESLRASKPYVALNAAAISRELFESELFGHRRGAYTGAVTERRGAFREAHEGTLFLDEIAALPPEQQAKLLRVVEEGVVRPLGAEGAQRVDTRLVAATCEPLEQMVMEQRFRADLFERLAVCVIRIPPLRERSEDIPALSKYLLCAAGFDDRELGLDALSALKAQRWPGNVRELRNVLVQAALRSDERISSADISSVLSERGSGLRRRITPQDAARIFERAGRNVSRAAREAALPRSTLRDLLRAAGR